MQESKNSPNNSEQTTSEKLFELDKEFAEFFIQNLPQELDKLKQVCEQNDVSAIKFQAHKLTPTLKMLHNEKAAKLLKSLSKLDGEAADIKQLARIAILEVESAIAKLQNA